MFSLSLTSLLLLMLAFLAVAGVPTLTGILAVASVLADPGVPILAGVLRTILYNDCYFFCNLTIGISHIGLAFDKLSDFNILDKGLNLSDYRISDTKKP